MGDEQDCADDTQANGCRGRKVEDSTEHYEYRSDSQHDRATQQDRQGIVVTSWNKNPNSNGDEGLSAYSRHSEGCGVGWVASEYVDQHCHYKHWGDEGVLCCEHPEIKAGCW